MDSLGRSFYHYLMTYRDTIKRDAATKFADDAFKDHSFPKQSTDYYELCEYLELNASYIPSMTLFDDVWSNYILDEEKNGGR